MIVLDTHIWVWWVHGDSRLNSSHAQLIKDHEDDEIGICTITLWEVAKLVELARLVLPVGLDQWFADALAYPGVVNSRFDGDSRPVEFWDVFRGQPFDLWTLGWGSKNALVVSQSSRVTRARP